MLFAHQMVLTIRDGLHSLVGTNNRISPCPSGERTRTPVRKSAGVCCAWGSDLLHSNCLSNQGKARATATVLVENALVALTCYATGRLGLLASLPPSGASPLWPPAGIAFAAVLLMGWRVLPGVGIGTMLSSTANAVPWAIAATIGSGNMVRTCIEVAGVKRWVAKLGEFANIGDVFRWLAISTIACAAAAGLSVGTMTLYGLVDHHEFGIQFTFWWMGDLMGSLLVAPLILSFVRPFPEPENAPRKWELPAFALGLLTTAWWIFREPDSAQLTRHLPYALIVLIGIGAHRFSLKVVSLGVLLLVSLSLGFTILGSGPFARPVLPASVLEHQLYIGIMALYSLCAASLVRRHRRDAAEIRAAKLELERRVEDRTRDLTSARDQLRRDIADRERVTAALEAKEREYRELVENANSIILRWNAEGKVTFLNKFGLRFFGYQEPEILGHHVVGTLVPEQEHSGRDLRQMIDQICADPQRFEQNVNQNMKRGGERVWVSWTNRLLCDRDGQPTGILSIGADITPQRQAEEALRKREIILATLAEVSSQLAVSQKMEDAFATTLSGLAEATKVTRACVFENQLTPQAPLAALRRAEWVCPDSRALDTTKCGERFSYEQHGLLELAERLAAGTPLVGAVQELPKREREFFGGSGVRSILIVPIRTGPDWWGFLAFEDWWDARVWTSAELEALKASASVLGATISRHQIEGRLLVVQRMEAVGQLAGGVAHDFTNLLTIIKGHLGLMPTVEHLPEEFRDSIREIGSATERAGELTRQLLAFGRRQVMNLRSTDLGTVVANLKTLLRRVLGEHIDFACQVDPQTPPVQADPGMLDQVILNLAMNARDAMPMGGHLTVYTRVEQIPAGRSLLVPEARPGRYVVLGVTDTGSGIPAEVLPHIYEPFFTTKGPGKGTGLGLATVYSIVRQHQGWIEIETAPDQGTAFRIYLPVVTGTTATSTAEARPAPAQGPTTGRETILLVEDETQVRLLARTSLRRQGYHVIEACNGVEAIRLWGQHKDKIDLLLTDMVMPEGISGKDLAGQVRSSRPDLPVIFSSGYPLGQVNQGSELQEGINYLPKPYAPDALVHFVRRTLDRVQHEKSRPAAQSAANQGTDSRN